MILTFGNKLAEDLFEGNTSKETRKFPPDLHRIAIRKLTVLNRAHTLEDLKAPPSNRLEKKLGKLKDYWAIRINDQWRILFLWTEEGPTDVQIVDYH
jgi:proteic killer suppression protein